MKLSISLNKPKVAPAAAPRQRPSAFSVSEEEDAEDDGLFTKARGKAEPLAHNAVSSKAMKRRMEVEKQVDETVFEYDEVWDKMQEAKAQQQAAKEVDASVRKPKYIHKLLTSAATRKLDHLRAEEKMMQLEREAEGDQFMDKESFVTQAYKDQMEEVRKAEEEENKRDELRKKQGGSSTGMTHFYRQLLEDSELNHEATVAATQKRIIGPQGPNVNLTITKPADFTPIADAELARLARETGKDVELNDDNQIVDKRELLSAGLNLSLPNTRFLGSRGPKKDLNNQGEQTAQIHRAVGTAASRKEINERRAREIQQQLEAEQQRVEKEQTDAEEIATRRIIAKRNNDVDVESARSRYLQRKRQKVEVSTALEES
ncbi:coiled-coil domain-containing protein 55-domain containing protein [Crassisporium funariophilum]|nr:coiled-coil domain-containing protein 55-domain containing protein [Crassisporium funariophilum]